MDNNKPLPRCPWCGAEMEIDTFENYLGWCGQAVCKECKSRAALKRHYVLQEEAEQAAYEAAMNRWREPNRVLTLDELQKRIEQGVDVEPLWMEFGKVPSASRWMVTNAPDEAFVNDTVKNLLVVSGYGCNGIWRCWLRKPTAAEMKSTPWERKKEG